MQRRCRELFQLPSKPGLLWLGLSAAIAKSPGVNYIIMIFIAEEDILVINKVRFKRIKNSITMIKNLLLISIVLLHVQARVVLQAAAHVALLPLDEDQPSSHVASVLHRA